MSDILEQDIQYLPGVGPVRKKLLGAELGIHSYADLLAHYPYKYVDRSKFYAIRDITSDMPLVQIRGRITSYEVFPLGMNKERVVAHFTDGDSLMDLVWFNGGTYARQTYTPGKAYVVFGRPTVFNGRINVVHPDISPDDDATLQGSGLQPFYPTTDKMKRHGINSRAIERIMRAMLARIPSPIRETLPDALIARRHLMSRDDALRTVHFPKDARVLTRARQRLKYEELFYVQLNIVRYANNRQRKYHGHVFTHVGPLFNDFYYNNLPFPLTNAQKRVVHEIHDDMRSGKQMNRLLQGDVGSGKTLVALMAMLLAIDNGFQACIMAPTEILAEQHLATMTAQTAGLNIRVALLTGTVKGKKREALLRDLAAGDINILVGTHAIIEDDVLFGNLGIVIIDEQHRFGVAQRARLWNKNDTPPHVLVMTATPIPRTLAMTLYGDLDVSVIDEMPPGRKPVITLSITDNRSATLYAYIHKQVDAGRQAYVVFPLIEGSEKSDLKNLEEGYETLCNVFPEYTLGKVHGKMKNKDKEEEMRRFVSGQTQILVATTVIEVGVNVPNASMMVIFDAHRFGLSQLHQLRGRVGRGSDQAYCILVTPETMGKTTQRRINIMCSTCDGFRIAEADLKIRGPGDLEGTQQSGMAFDLKIADIARDGLIVQMARDDAQMIIGRDPEYAAPEYAVLWNRLKELRKTDINWASIS